MSRPGTPWREEATLKRIAEWEQEVTAPSRKNSSQRTSKRVSSYDSSYYEGEGSQRGFRRNVRARTKTAIEKDAEELSMLSRFDKLRYLGRTTPYRTLDKELKTADPDPVLLAYLKARPNVTPPTNPEDWVFVEANSLVELNHLERFNRDYAPLRKEHMEAVQIAAEHVEDLLSLPTPLEFPEVEDLREVRYLGDKFPGVEYAFQGLKTRREAHTIALAEAESCWVDLMDGKRVRPQLNRIGGRGKMVKKVKLEATQEKPTSGRLIFMTGHRDLLLNGVTEQRLTAAYRPDRYPISVGTSWWHEGTRLFFERFKEYSLFHCFDAEKFDSSLPPWLIKIALNILRGQFWDGWNDRYNAYWEFIFEGLVYAPVYLDNGLQFERNGGSTSGHSFNTLMQSICTLILAYTCLLEVHGVSKAEEVFSNMWVEALGDDQHTGVKGVLDKYDIEDIAPVAERVFGVSWWGDKSFNTTRLSDTTLGAFQGSQYLGKYTRILDESVGGVRVQGVVPYRPFEETFLRLYYPERMKEGWTEAWMRAVGHYADGAGNPETRAFLEGYLDWLEPSVEADSFTWSEKWLRKFNNQDPTGPTPLPARRITYLEWLSLILTSTYGA